MFLSSQAEAFSVTPQRKVFFGFSDKNGLAGFRSKMAVNVSMPVSLQSGIYGNHGRVRGLRHFNPKNLKTRGRLCLLGSDRSSVSQEQYSWSTNISERFLKRAYNFPCKSHMIKCKCSLNPSLGLGSLDTSFVKNAALNLAWSFKNWQGSPAMVRLASTTGILIFTIWGIGPVVHLSRNLFWNKSNSSGEKSGTYDATASYNLHSCYLSLGATIVCRALELMVSPIGTCQFVVELSNQFVVKVLHCMGAALALGTFNYRLLSVIQPAQEYMEKDDVVNIRKMCSGIVGRAVSLIVWFVVLTVFLELLGYPIPKMLVARTVVIFLFIDAGHEIFMNAHPRSTINVTQPFVVNKGIQTNIERYEVSGAAKTGFRFPGGVVFVVVLAAVMTLVIELLGSSLEQWGNAVGLVMVCFMFVGRQFVAMKEGFQDDRPLFTVHIMTLASGLVRKILQEIKGDVAMSTKEDGTPAD